MYSNSLAELVKLWVYLSKWMWIATDITATQSFFIFVDKISFELRILIIVAIMLCYLSSSEKKAWKIRDSNPDLCDAGAVINHLSHQANWELVIMWVYDKPVDIQYGLINEIFIWIFGPFVLYCSSGITELRRSLAIRQSFLFFCFVFSFFEVGIDLANVQC